MGSTNRRDLVRVLGGLLPLGALAAVDAMPAAAAENGPPGFLDEQRAQEIIASVKPAVVLLESETETGTLWGSGFFVSADGLLITNNHVVRGTQKLSCLLRNKDRLTAKVLKTDSQYDLALVKVDVPRPVTTVSLGDSEAVSEGLLVAVTGYPAPNMMVWLGMALDSSTSRGAVNGLRYGGDANTLVGDRSLQIDAPVTHGNSGGPVFRLDTGEVIGVISIGLTGAGNATFAVPINQAKVLISGTGMKAAPAVAKPSSPEAVVAPGDLRALNTIGAGKELPRLFGQSIAYTEQFEVTAKDAYDDWAVATGEHPAKVTPLVIHGTEIFFGAIDGKLRRWDITNLSEMLGGGMPVLLDVGSDQIFIYPPAVNDEIICASSGSLDLDQKLKEKFDPVGLLSIGLFGFGRVTKTKQVVELEGTGSLFGLNRRNGNIDWEVNSGFVGTPALYQSKVYYGGLGQYGCVEAVQGKELWKAGRKKGASADWYHVGYAGPLGLLGLAVPVEGKRTDEEGLHLSGDGKARVEAYEPGSGKVLWKTEIGDIKNSKRPLSTAMFLDEGKKVVYALSSQIVAAVDATSGKLLWSYDHAKALAELQKKSKGEKKPLVSFTSHMVISDGIIYVGSEDRKLHAFNGEDGKELWTYNTRAEVGHPNIHEGQILVGSRDGYLHVVDARTGQLSWRVQLSNAVRTQPVVKNGMVYVATEAGKIHSVRVPVA